VILLYQPRDLDMILWPFMGPRTELSYLLLAAIGVSFLLALYERATRVPQGPAWSLLIAIPWITLVACFVIDRISTLSWILHEGYETDYSPSRHAQQLGEIAVALLAVCVMRILASRAMKLQFIRLSYHLFTGAMLLMFWSTLERHNWLIATHVGGYEVQDEHTFVYLRAASALYSGLTIGVLCLLGSIFLVIWNRRRNRIAAQITRIIR
jgi:hypothetical protein